MELSKTHKSPIRIASMLVEVEMQIFITRVRMIINFQHQRWTSLTMNRTLETPSMCLKVSDRSRTSLRTYIHKVVKLICNSITIPIIIVDRETFTSQGPVTLHLDRCSESYGVVLAVIVNQIIKCKAVALRSLVHFLGKQMPILR